MEARSTRPTLRSGPASDALAPLEERVPGERDRPFAALAFCSLASLGAFLVPIVASAMLAQSPVVESTESSGRLQSVGRSVAVQPLQGGALVPEVRVEDLPEGGACFDESLSQDGR